METLEGEAHKVTKKNGEAHEDKVTKKNPGRPPRRSARTKDAAAESVVLAEAEAAESNEKTEAEPEAAKAKGKARAKPKAASGKAKKKADGLPAAKKTTAIRAVKRKCKQKVVAEMDAIITGLIEKAKKDCSTAKFLIGFADEPGSPGKGAGDTETIHDDSLAELLLERLEGKAGPAADAGQREEADSEPGLQTARAK